MWTKVAHFILKFRLFLICFLALITVFMAYQTKDLEMSYDFAKIVPADDQYMVYFQDFKRKFGEDGNLLVIGTKDSTLYQYENFQKFKYFHDDLSRLKGINNVVSLPGLEILIKDQARKKFIQQPIFEDFPEDQQGVDSLLQVATSMEFYDGLVVNRTTGATILLVSIDKDILNSENRQGLMDDILRSAEAFSDDTGIALHYAGLPFIRSVMTGKMKDELNLFLILSLAITAVILYAFFRSFQAVIFPMIVIGVMVVWSLGTLALFGFKITILTGLIPPIIVVIGIPNCIYLLNKYHQEFNIHGNKIKALSRIIRKIGLVTLITNFTTAIGFVVLAFTDIVILKEFGFVAGINIFATFFVSIILIPAVFSYLPAPQEKHLRHLDFGLQAKFLTGIDILVHRHKYRIFFVTGAIVVVSLIGVYKIESVSFMVDDIPKEGKIKQDMLFFEDNFQGVMPLEIVVDTGKKRGIMRLENLKKVDELQDFLVQQPSISKPLSIINFVKASRQAFYNNNVKFYSLPNNQDKAFIISYLRGQRENNTMMNSFVDSTGQYMRISLKVADIGSIKLDSLVHKIVEPAIVDIFAETDLQATVTGTTLLFVKGNKFLIENLRMSLVLAFFIIALIMGILFQNVRMIVISLIPNVIPLLITGALMGYMGIPLKPSTALIFSIAFGISVDDSIHFLAKYRQELYANNFFVAKAVSKSIMETGASMMYTSVVLFAGFVIFAGSEFGGTAALGILTSTTLLIAMFTNLILLPALLLSFDDGKRKGGDHPPIEQYGECYQWDDDEEIDIEKIQVINTDTA